ncbi:MAG TPA: hypothetical protein VJ673_19925 [Aromatoleum sp.]|uniref:hypothetical protein n=1 Tax=Aromatoleum sp. TaxID=2307007 RepID=UPI002B49767A|nr:hypothetical protein [Aromatoleum sp.]HJV27959.1 hypothetical protein [Aromatoleum sp.]
MPIVIDELVAEVRPDPEPASSAGAEPLPPEGKAAEALRDALAVTREREARLAID